MSSHQAGIFRKERYLLYMSLILLTGCSSTAFAIPKETTPQPPHRAQETKTQPKQIDSTSQLFSSIPSTEYVNSLVYRFLSSSVSQDGRDFIQIHKQELSFILGSNGLPEFGKFTAYDESGMLVQERLYTKEFTLDYIAPPKVPDAPIQAKPCYSRFTTSLSELESALQRLSLSTAAENAFVRSTSLSNDGWNKTGELKPSPESISIEKFTRGEDGFNSTMRFSVRPDGWVVEEDGSTYDSKGSLVSRRHLLKGAPQSNSTPSSADIDKIDSFSIDIPECK
jgi:hypothetical protein